jgi:ATP-dependent Clp protease ATP-binding subunit ClpC
MPQDRPMFEKLSQNAIRVVMLAQEEARRLGSKRVGSEHLLLGLLRDTQGVARAALLDQGIDLDPMRELVAAKAKPAMGPGDVHYSSHTKMTIELAEAEAARLNDGQVDAEHLLMGMLTLGEGLAVRLLEGNGVTLPRLRWQTIRLRRAGPGGTRVTPTLEQYTRDLTMGAVQPTRILPWGRRAVIEQTLELLGTQRRSVPLLYGPPGTALSGIVAGVVEYLLSGLIFDHMAHYRVLALDMSLLRAETETLADFRQALRQLLGEALRAKDVILVIEAVHTLIFAAPDTKEAIAAELLLPLLQDGDMACITTTDPEAAEQLLRTDPYRKFFTGLPVPETSYEETLHLLDEMRSAYQLHHQLQIPDATLESAVRWARLALPGDAMPMAAVRLLDRAAARRRFLGLTNRYRARDLERQLRQLKQERDRLGAEPDPERLTEIRQTAKTIEAELADLSGDLLAFGEQLTLMPTDIAAYAELVRQGDPLASH